MATKKITEQAQAQSVKDAASVLITQHEPVEEGSEEQAESLRRASLAQLISALKNNGILDGMQTSQGIMDMYPDLVKSVVSIENGIRVTYWDETYEDIEIQSGGLAFDAISYDQQTGYFHITLGGEDVVDPCYIGGGGGGGSSGSVITITNRMPSRTFAITDTTESCAILFSATSVDSETEEPTGNLTANWYVNGNRVSIQNIPQGNGQFEVRNYLTNGATNTVKLVIEDTYGGSKSMIWTVTVTAYTMSWNIEDFANHGEDAFNLRLVPNGQGDKTVKVTVDGEEIYSQVVATSGRAIAITVPAQDHGAHTVLAWMQVTVDGSTITTEPLRHVGIWVDPDDDTPIVAIYGSSFTASQYNTLSIRYRVYDPSSETATVYLNITGEDERTLNVGRSTQVFAYRPTTSGNKQFALTCGEESAVATINVTATEYDIHPVTRGLIADLDPSGHTNTESGAKQFGYKDQDGVNHPLTFSENFDWVSGGFQQDSEGITALVIKRGSYVEFDRSFFNDDAKVSGKEIKVVFKTTECRNYDAEVFNCVADNIGLKLQAQQAVLSSALQSATVQYCEDKKIEMDVNIEATSEDQLAVIWLEGVPSRGIAYAASDNWQQTTPKRVKIGSADCDVWIYRIKLYSTSLTRFEVLDNFTADCANTTEMVARYERNDIFNTNGTINEQKLATVKPELRIIHITADRMTTSKSDKVTCTVTLTYRQGGADYEFTATGVKMFAQGTSSLEYILAALNLDLDFSSATSWVDGNDVPITKYSMTPNSIGVNYLNIKLNVASSENANNVCMTDDYNTFQPYINPSRVADPRVRDTIEGHPCAVFFTNSSGETIEIGARTLGAGETFLYGVGDLCNSKKNYAVFGQDTSTYPEQCCVEIGNNNNPQTRFKSDDLSDETWDGEGNFEFRYPKNPTDANKAAWQRVLSWVVSTDTTQATGDALPEPVTYGGKTYTTDTEAYRAAKFVAEFGDYFSKDAMLYHYLITERQCMVDNRAKNTFISYEYDEDAEDYRWNICKNYDDDTMAGNDNSGGLTFTYGLEDTDMVGAAYVFNAYDSVLWCNIRDYMFDDLKRMYLDRESEGAWNAERITAKWKNYQSARPEALIVEDMWGKYFTPFIALGETRYIGMMLGTKEDQFRQFQTYQERYMSAKYGGAVSTADRISLRANAPEGEQAVPPCGDISGIVPYAKTYITVKYGNAGTVRIRAERGQSYDVEMPAGASLNDLETYIYSASNIASIDSLAALYTKLCDVSSAVKLQQLLLGSGVEGYSNTSLKSESGGVALGTNILMEKIDLRGTPNLEQGLDLTALKALEEIYTTGSGVTGVTFAQRAPVKVVELNAVRQLVCRDLLELETFDVPYNGLQTIWIDNCPFIDTKAMVSGATGLTRGRLIGIDWTGQKALNNSQLLIRLSGLSGLDATGGNIDTFVLTGAAHVAMISSDDIATIEAKFPELELTYDAILPSYTVTFKNWDESVLNTQRVDQGSAPIDPRYLPVSPIPTPTRESTPALNFSFDGWSWTNGGVVIEDISQITITGNTTLYAHFAETARTYTVRWYNGTDLLETQSKTYGECATYTGSIPRHPSEGEYSLYYLFKGWDKSTGRITENIDVYAQYDNATIPAAGKPLSQMVPAELSALVSEGYLSSDGSRNTYISSGDTIDITFGHDKEYSNVESHELISLSSPKVFDGTNYFKPQIDGEDILLFDEDKSFTLAIDLKYAEEVAGNTLMACYESGGMGIFYSSGPAVKFGLTSNVNAGTTTGRDVIVLRHLKGEKVLHVYGSKKSTDTKPATQVLNTTITIPNYITHDAPLVFGATMASDGYLENYAKGTVYWAKYWEDDLGEADCLDLARWPHETYTFQAAGSSQRAFRSYKRADTGRYVNCCFLMKNLLSVTHKQNQSGTNAGGWNETSMREWLNLRLWDALPIQWRQLILKVWVFSSEGSQSTAIIDPPAEDYLWIPCCKDVGLNTTTNPYASESDSPFTIFTNDASRIKKMDNGSGSASFWWLRSPATSTSHVFWYVGTNGSSFYNSASYSDGVAFGFCI